MIDIKKIIEDPAVESPKGKTNWKDKLVALKDIFFSKVGLFWIAINAFFGPEFFHNVADWCTSIGVILPKNSFASIALALAMWGVGSLCIYLAKLKERKNQGE